MEILDTAGSDEFSMLIDLYLPHSDAFIVCVNQEEDFEAAELALLKIQKVCDFRPLPVVVVSTKCDLSGDERVDTKPRAVRLAHQYMCEWMTCSAKTGEGVIEVFEKVTRMAMFRILDSTLPIPHRRRHRKQQSHNKCNMM